MNMNIKIQQLNAKSTHIITKTSMYNTEYLLSLPTSINTTLSQSISIQIPFFSELTVQDLL